MKRHPLALRAVMKRMALSSLLIAVALGDQRVVDLVLVDAVAAAVLGDVAGGVGGGEHVRQVAAVAVDGHEADRDAHLEDLVAPAEAELAHGAPHLLSDLPRVIDRAVLEQHAELVAAEAGEGVATAHP